MTHSELINLWPSLSAFAADLSVEYGTAKAMRRRSSVPPEYWLAMARAAADRKIDVTLETLAEAAAATPEKST